MGNFSERRLALGALAIGIVAFSFSLFMDVKMKHSRCFFSTLMVLGGLLQAVDPLSAQTTPSAGMLRFADVSAEHIVFVYAEDLWLAPRAGGTASLLASPKGEESLPRFSPDGKTVAFVANYDGNDDIYTIGVEGGPAHRVTYHPTGEQLSDWTADGKLIFSSNAYSGLGRQTQLFVQGPQDPMETQLPVPYGSNAAISADGQWLAYTPHSRDYRTWKRYRGGMASDIWLFNLQTNESRQITDFEGTDSFPMWQGSVVYYLSDAGDEHRLNIWQFNSVSGERKQVTRFADHDCKFPSIGPGTDGNGEIILQNGKGLYLINLASEAVTEVVVTIPGDRPLIRPNIVDASKFISGVHLSPSAKRVAVEARGDLWTLPAKNGSPRNLTRTSGVAERDPAWSPDGKWLAYFSDATEEYELYISQSDGIGETKQLTQNGNCYRYSPTWSPDSKWLTFADKTGSLFLVSMEGGEPKLLDREPSGGQISVSWSHDSRWITYSRGEDLRSPSSAIWVYNVVNGTKQRLTAGFFNDDSPTFDRKGEYIFFTSSRAFNAPKYEDVGTSFIYSDTEVLMGLPLRKDVKVPFQPKSDEESWKDGDKTKDADKGDAKPKDDKEKEKEDGKDKAEDKKADEQPPFQIDFDGSEARSFPFPVDAGSFGGLAVNDKGHLIYARSGSRGGSGTSGIFLIDLEDEKAEQKSVVEGSGNFMITPDGKKLLVMQGREKMSIVDAAPAQKLTDSVPTKGMEMTIDPRAEWKQIFAESWRVQRDFFYDPNMHGVDWPAVRAHYGSMLDDCYSRRDLSFLIKEMIAELNVGHAYYREGDVEDGDSRSVGMLGCRFELVDGGYKLKDFYTGADWDYDARNPLIVAGAKEGQFLVAVNGVPVSIEESPYKAFLGMAGMTVTLTVSDDAVLDANDKQVVVKLLSSDADLRFRHWIEGNRRHVEKASDGKIGYIFVTNTGVPGQNDLVRMLYGQINKDALIIDERWNGGGQIPTRFIELLNRPATNGWARRDGRDWVWPPDSHQGPKCMLANGMSGSGGDMFPALFKMNKLGPVIGTRTWGGLVGISGGPTNIDGSSVTPPTFAYYDLDGTWGIEGHGVDPDIQVVDDPAKMLNGADPQLDAAIAEMLKAIEERGFKAPVRPAYPDRSKMGIAPEDK